MLELARVEDREAINRISFQCHSLHVAWRPDIYKMEPEMFPEEFFRECIRERKLYTARLHGQTVGYVMIRFHQFGGIGNVPRKVLLLEQIAVEESFRNQGIGTVMMQDVMALAKAFGCTDIQLSVYLENDAALTLYRRLGFAVRNINLQRKVD